MKENKKPTIIIKEMNKEIKEILEETDSTTTEDEENGLRTEKDKMKKLQNKTKEKRENIEKYLTITLGTPIKPQLAKASKSYEDSIMRNPNGFFIETKYDGERIQVLSF
jgi:ATP-dependent DNA ligase